MVLNLGFMQGRLVAKVNGKIQAFPIRDWKHEFFLAAQHSFTFMEWTVDRYNIFDNPIMTDTGQLEIVGLAREHRINIKSITADCCMQKPFWKETNSDIRRKEVQILKHLIDGCGRIGAKIIVLPVVDNSAFEDTAEQQLLFEGVSEVTDLLKSNNIKIAFEIDYPPEDITKFIRVFDEDTFGINYDTGNSANKGYDVDAEWAAYGDRILNVHIKDRSHNGSTTRLGTGDVDFQKFKSNLKKQRYNGMCILQTARSFVNKELDETLLNADFIRNLFNEQ